MSLDDFWEEERRRLENGRTWGHEWTIDEFNSYVPYPNDPDGEYTGEDEQEDD